MASLQSQEVFNEHLTSSIIYHISSQQKIVSMIYTRNKDSFKKTTHKTQHSEAQANILLMVKDIISKRGEGALPENKSKNIPDHIPKAAQERSPEKPKQKIILHKKMEPVPKLCESRYESSKQATMDIFNTYNLAIQIPPGSSALAHKNYVQLLERKICELEQAIDAKARDIQELKKRQILIQQASMKEDEDKARLQRFYHSSRNCLVLMSTELIECKKIAVESKNQERLKSINGILNKSEELMEVYRGLVEMTGRRMPQEKERKVDVKNVIETNIYLQKTIEFLRKENQEMPHFNEVRLLRHQINRISKENEKLLQRVHGKNQAVSPNRKSAEEGRNAEDIRENLVKLESGIKSKYQADLNHAKMEFEQNLKHLRVEMKEKSDLAVKYKEEKQCLIEFLDQARSRNQHLQIAIRGYQQEIQNLTQALSKATHSGKQKLVLETRDAATTQEFMKVLKPYPKYQKLLMDIVSLYEEKVSLLQEKVIEERMVKDKFMEWSSSVYRLLEKANISPEIVEAHMAELYSFDKEMDNSQIEKCLRQIRSLSVGVDESEIREMETELLEYIISLKDRNQVIKEVDIEDGSSVALSETFTDRQLD